LVKERLDLKVVVRASRRKSDASMGRAFWEMELGHGIDLRRFLSAFLCFDLGDLYSALGAAVVQWLQLEGF
jgi:hypothetical protein